MVNLICGVSKYFILLFMILYTIKCFSSLIEADEAKMRKKTLKQIVYVYMIHGLMYLTLYLRMDEVRVLIFYVVQIVVAVTYMLVFRAMYRESSPLLTNNAAFLLLIGYTMLTRLDFTLAVKQFIFATIGLIISLFIPYCMLKWKGIKNYGVTFGIVGLVLLLTVFVPGLGKSLYGSRNWISIGRFSLQPMEFVKILFVFFVAATLVKAKTFRELMVNAVISACFMGVLVLEKDLGAAVIFYVTYVSMVYLVTSRVSLFIGGLGLGVGAIFLAYKLFKDSLFAHVMVRVEAWKDPFAHIDTGGYQVSQSLFAMGTGGWLGSGLNQGAADTIPVSESDFIFSAICEELGVFFGLMLILVIISIFISFVNVALKCKSPFYKYAAFGFAVIYIAQSLLNLGGVIKFIPSTGVTLPLVSYGVSSVISTLMIFAIVQGVYVISNKEAQKIEKEKEHARAVLEQRIAVARGAAPGAGN